MKVRSRSRVRVMRVSKNGNEVGLTLILDR